MGGEAAPRGREATRSGAGLLRLADLLAALSLSMDLGMAFPPEEALRAALLATGLARRLRLPEREVGDVYYTTLLRFVGCTAYAHEEAAMQGGDDIALRVAGATIDDANPRDMLRFLLSGLAPQRGPFERARRIVGMMTLGERGERHWQAAHCEVGAAMARRLGLPPGVQQALAQTFERWDGKGGPQRLSGDAIATPVRFALVAHLATLFDHLGGPQAAAAAVRQRAGGQLDPAIADAFGAHGPALLAEVANGDAWTAVLAAEPSPWRLIAEPQLDDAARAFADMVDLKLTFTRGHSTGVAALAATAARGLRLTEAEIVAVRRAGLLHDLGRVAVPNGVWEKPGPLARSEWEQVRLHAYHSERILACSPILAPLAPLAGMHHERQDGSGYHRQAAGAMVPLDARLIAAADAYHAMTEPRPHRAALSATDAAEQLRAESAAGRLDPDAVGAVLLAAGHAQAGPRRAWPAGLSDREVEVLRLIARGASYREVARTLTISPKTAEHHIEHIYNKIGVSSRAAAAMFAMEHDLLVR
jgi:HD-GYP domain-containing protein (c-di-GMP phosphodiesterase class II)